MTTLKIKVITPVTTKRQQDRAVRYNCTAVTAHNDIAHVSCSEEQRPKMTGYCMVKGFRINPKPDRVFVDFAPGHF